MGLKRIRGALTIVILALSGGSFAVAQDSPERQIHWMHSAPKASAVAREVKLPILVYVSCDDCGYCRRMYRDCWRTPQIISMVGNGYVPLSLDSDRDAELVAALNVHTYPTTLLYTPDGKFVDGVAGYVPPKHLAGLLKRGRQAKHMPPHATQTR